MAVTIPFRLTEIAASSPVVDELQQPLDSLVAPVVPTAGEVAAEWIERLDLLSFDDAEPTPIYRTVQGRELFGYQSVQAEIPMGEPNQHLITETPSYGFLVLTLIALFALLICQHTGDIGQLWSRIFHDRGSTERLIEGQNYSTSRVVTILNVLGMFLLGASILRLVAPQLSTLFSAPLSLWMGLIGALAITALLYLVILYQRTLLGAIGALTFSGETIAYLYQIKRALFAVATLLTAPFLGLMLLAPTEMGEVWLWVIIIELFILVFLYLYESLLLFISKKVSVLHWILYLCTVEILPFATILIAVNR